MRFRTIKAGNGWVLQVEDGDGVLFTVPLGNPDEARALVSKARAEGIDAIRPMAATKKAKK